jgi:hypothetical protein
VGDREPARVFAQAGHGLGDAGQPPRQLAGRRNALEVLLTNETPA